MYLSIFTKACPTPSRPCTAMKSVCDKPWIWLRRNPPMAAEEVRSATKKDAWEHDDWDVSILISLDGA